MGPDFAVCAFFVPRFALSRRTLSVEPDQSLEVVGEVGHADFGGGAGNADGAHGQTHDVFDAGKGMLHEGAYS